MKKIFLFVTLLLPFSMYAQHPGGVSGSNTLWLKANTGITLNGTNVGTWAEQSGANITGNFSTQGTNISMGTQNQPAYVANGINFNPQVSFIQVGPTSISSNNSFAGLTFINATDNYLVQVIKLHSITGTGVFFKWQYLNTNSQRLGCEVNNGSQPGKMRVDFRGLTTYSTTNINNTYYLTDAAISSTQVNIRLNGNVDATGTYTSAQGAFAPTTNARVTIGNEEYGDAYPTTIDVAEEILFARALTTVERNKVESYLAVKYGFTLSQNATNANDYTSAGGTNIWNHADNINYDNNITGIGRDDSSALNQYQSKSYNAAGIVTIYYGGYNGNNLPVLNTDNIHTFSADNSFLLFGDNALDTSLGACFAGNPSLHRMNRVWKFQKTGTIDTVTLTVPSTMVPSAVRHLIVSTDPNFTTATTTVYALDTVGGIKSKAVFLPDSGYFTYASDSLLAHATSNSPVCQGGTIQLTGNISNATSYQWTGPNAYTSTAQSPSIANAVPADSGLYILNGAIGACAVTPDTILVVVHPTPPGPAVTSPITYCLEATATALSATGQGLVWYGPTVPTGSATAPIPVTTTAGTFKYYVTQVINGCASDSSEIDVIVKPKPDGPATSAVIYCQGDVPMALSVSGDSVLYYTPPSAIGSPVPPTPNTATADTLTYYVTQTVNGCRSDSSAIQVFIKYKPNIVINESDTQVCLNNTLTFTYAGNATDDAMYNWVFPSGDNIVSGSGKGPITVSFNQLGYQPIQFSVNNNGCLSNDTTFYINVVEAPAPVIAFAKDVCQGSAEQISLANAINGVSNYNWMFQDASSVSGSDAGPYSVIWDTPGNYAISVSVTVNGCPSATAVDTVTVHTLPVIHITGVSKNNICIGDSVLFTASAETPVYAYQWLPEQYFTFGNLSETYGVIDSTGYISVRGISDYGCVNTDSVLVTAQPCCRVDLPNAFTPNNDGKNDVFRIIAQRPQKIIDFRIVNRWGQVIYTATDNIGWDGSFNGTQQDMGTYYYMVTYVCADGKQYFQKGEVILIR